LPRIASEELIANEEALRRDLIESVSVLSRHAELQVQTKHQIPLHIISFLSLYLKDINLFAKLSVHTSNCIAYEHKIVVAEKIIERRCKPQKLPIVPVEDHRCVH
jgi:hypothetical protein